MSSRGWGGQHARPPGKSHQPRVQMPRCRRGDGLGGKRCPEEPRQRWGWRRCAKGEKEQGGGQRTVCACPRSAEEDGEREDGTGTGHQASCAPKVPSGRRHVPRQHLALCPRPWVPRPCLQLDEQHCSQTLILQRVHDLCSAPVPRFTPNLHTSTRPGPTRLCKPSQRRGQQAPRNARMARPQATASTFL